jgi:anthraniloyl-CoA monooxygenase
MKVLCVGGGPAGLYFSILMKLADRNHEVIVLERNRPEDTYGFGVVFSDATLKELSDADRDTYLEITRAFHHWDDIDIHYRGERLASSGHGFSGISRTVLLKILEDRCAELGVELRHGAEVDSVSTFGAADLVVASDGVNSWVRGQYKKSFSPTIDRRSNRFVWLGTTKPFPAFTFYFRSTEHGLWRVHAYQYRDDGNLREPTIKPVSETVSTFIVEATESTWRAAGMDSASAEETTRHLEDLFAAELGDHSLIANQSEWRQFPTVRNDSWHHDNVVLIGDAAHTAHFSIGSGTRMAMVDAIALRDALIEHECDIRPALAAYELERRPEVESLQRAAQASLEWFEGMERFMNTEPLQFAFNLITRSLRITHSNLKLRDPTFTASVNAWFTRQAFETTGIETTTPGSDSEQLSTTLSRSHPEPSSHPPLFAPFRLRDLVLNNRVVVSAMCQYSAEDGAPDDWHLVHLGSRAVGGAGLVMSEMTDVSREGRISLGCTGMYLPSHVGAWKRIVDFVHGHTSAKIGIQLGHAGRKSSTHLSWVGDNEPLDSNGWPIMAASPLPWFKHSQVPREMTREDMDQVVDQFRAAAELSEEAGFDLLEVHFAHGYLLASFISPLTNVRKDEYGGSLDGRMRFPLEVLAAVREVWPADKPISVRISAVDWAPGGLDPDNAVEVARRLKRAEVDIIDVSAGQTVPNQKPLYGRQFQTPFSDRIRHEVEIPTMAVGNISSFMDVNTILAAGRADLCCLARAHLWEPYWTRHAAYTSGAAVPWPPQYSTLDGYTPRFEWEY